MIISERDQSIYITLYRNIELRLQECILNANSRRDGESMVDSDDEGSFKYLSSLFMRDADMAVLGKVAAREDWQDYLILDGAIKDVGSLIQAYFRGFEHAAAHGAADGTDVLAKWARQVDRRRSLWNIASVAATALCAALEGFLRSVSDRWINTDVVSKMRTTSRGPELSADYDAARKRLRDWLKPSTRDGGEKWLGRVGDIFEVELDPKLANELVLMVSQRNRFVHAPRPARDSEYQAPSGDKVASWPMAVWVLCQTVLRAVSVGHLARREAELRALSTDAT